MRPGRSSFTPITPDPDFPFKLTEQGFSAPIPPGTPDHDLGVTPIPARGPYRFATVNAIEVRFLLQPVLS